MTAKEFAERIVEDMHMYIDRELVVPHMGMEVYAVVYALRCLANPACEGSREALDAILARRAEKEAKG